MSKPVIGISASMILESEGEIFLGYQRSYTNDDYIQAVSRAGGIPIVLPIVDSEEEIMAQIELLDGLIMMGGHDISPELYSEEPGQKLGFIYPRRDNFDFKLVKGAFEKKLPILGICRGHQMINVVFGGTLYQDLSEIEGCRLAHVQKTFCYEPVHKINISEDSHLYKLIGEEMKVNSFHHLAVKDVAENFDVVALSSDGVIEAIEYSKEQYIMGVQFHPEMMSSKNDKAQNIFNGLIQEAKKFKESKK